jgi:DHA1 family bicyclomycin/chloramphenicol resistance-like MFS transporter
MAIQPAKLSFTIFLGALAALPPLSIDMGLPAFPQVEAQLGASASEVTQTLSLFLLGFATGPLLLGPLSDRFGRRPILLTGLVIFVLAGLGCALATDLRMLLGFRLLQGIGAGAGATLPFAIVRDLFDGVQARMRMSAVTLVLGVGPIIAPLLGACLLMIGDWRLIYAALALGGLLLLAITGFGFRESSPEGKHHSVSPRRMLSSYGHVLSNRTFLGNSLVNAGAFSAMFAYISGSPSVLMGNLGASSSTYSFLFACSAAAFVLGSALNGTLAARLVSAHRIVLAANVCLVIGSVGIVMLTLTGTLQQESLAALAALSIFGCGLSAPHVAHDALQPMGRQAGVAAAALRSMQMLFGALASALVGLLYDGRTALALGGVMAAFALLSLLAQVTMLRPARRPRHEAEPAGAD